VGRNSSDTYSVHVIRYMTYHWMRIICLVCRYLEIDQVSLAHSLSGRDPWTQNKIVDVDVATSYAPHFKFLMG
jgi:hypothetical protein